MTNIDLSKCSILELKGMAYDWIAQKEISEGNLRAINQEISKRLQVPMPAQQEASAEGVAPIRKNGVKQR